MANYNYNPNDITITITDDASHSASVVGYLHDLNISGLVKNGKVIETYESQGAATGVRYAARQYPTVSFGKQLLGAIDAFSKLLNGTTAGFTSVLADIGDVVAVDLVITWTAGGVAHDFTMADCFNSGTDTADGNPVGDSYNLTCIGPVSRDGETIISSR